MRRPQNLSASGVTADPLHWVQTSFVRPWLPTLNLVHSVEQKPGETRTKAGKRPAIIIRI